MKKRYLFLLTSLSILLLFGASIISHGCGSSGGSGSTTDYTIQGKLSSLTASGVNAFANSTVTHIVAIGSSGEKYLASLASDGTFSVALNRGVSYAFGFYNKTGSTITLLGYLQQTEVSWESLPLMNPADASTDLGTVEIHSASLEAIPSINLTSLISKMNIVDNATAVYYGEIDGPMTVFTNIDVDGNGVFDFQEGKSYLFQTYVNVNNGTGQIANMQNGLYNESYYPTPESYTVVLTCQGDSQTVGTAVTFHFPAAVKKMLRYIPCTPADTCRFQIIQCYTHSIGYTADQKTLVIIQRHTGIPSAS